MRDSPFSPLFRAAAGTAPIPAPLFDLFRPLLASASREEAAAVLAPGAVRALKRSPELAVGAVGAMLGALLVDLGEEHAALLPPLLSAARSSKEDVRAAAVVACAALARRATGAAAVALLVQQVCAIIGGSEGRVKEVPQRCALWGTLGAGTPVPPTQPLAHLSRF